MKLKKRGRQAAVTPAMCGLRNTFGKSRMPLAAGIGSGSKTSSETRMSPRAARAISASESTIGSARDVDEHAVWLEQVELARAEHPCVAA